LPNFIRTYTESPEFSAKYKAAREEANPGRNAGNEDLKYWRESYPPTVKELVILYFFPLLQLR